MAEKVEFWLIVAYRRRSGRRRIYTSKGAFKRVCNKAALVFKKVISQDGTSGIQDSSSLAAIGKCALVFFANSNEFQVLELKTQTCREWTDDRCMDYFSHLMWRDSVVEISSHKICLIRPGHQPITIRPQFSGVDDSLFKAQIDTLTAYGRYIKVFKDHLVFITNGGQLAAIDLKRAADLQTADVQVLADGVGDFSVYGHSLYFAALKDECCLHKANIRSDKEGNLVITKQGSQLFTIDKVRAMGTSHSHVVLGSSSAGVYRAHLFDGRSLRLVDKVDLSQVPPKNRLVDGDVYPVHSMLMVQKARVQFCVVVNFLEMASLLAIRKSKIQEVVKYQHLTDDFIEGCALVGDRVFVACQALGIVEISIEFN